MSFGATLVNQASSVQTEAYSFSCISRYCRTAWRLPFGYEGVCCKQKKGGSGAFGIGSARCSSGKYPFQTVCLACCSAFERSDGVVRDDDDG